MALAVECKNVSKKYNKDIALEDLNLSLEENKIYGLLGRNGAGKTTILNIISAHVFNDNGEVKVFGETPYEN
jgi:ABC-2 type transport system ATP-binding protein